MDLTKRKRLGTTSKNFIIWYSSFSIATRPQGLKTGVRTVVLYLHVLTCTDVKSGMFGDNDNPTHNCEWTTLKRQEVTESLGKPYKVSFVTYTFFFAQYY